MEYVTLNQGEKIDFYRRQLRQAEADHFTHQFEFVSADETVKALPAKPASGPDPQASARENAIALRDQRKALRDAAEKRALKAKLELDALSASYVEPEPETPDEPGE